MSSHPFVEVDDFVDVCIRSYALDLHRYALPMKSAFATYLRENPRVKAVFVGTRRTDPHGEFLNHFDRTDHGWPDFMRVQPVIDWHYQEVWAVSYPGNREREGVNECIGVGADAGCIVPERARGAVLLSLRHGVHQSRRHDRHASEPGAAVAGGGRGGGCETAVPAGVRAGRGSAGAVGSGSVSGER